MLQKPRVGVGAIIRQDNRVLLMKRQNSHGDGTWSPPGGHLEYGEAIEICAAREALEETGVVAINFLYLGLTNDIFIEEQKHYITIWMVGEYVSGEAHIHSPRETSEVAWFPWESLPKPLFLPFQNLLNGTNAFISQQLQELSH